MLLQLVYDEMMHRKFGDIGAYQFWIPPDDLAQGNWAAMRLTSKAIDELTAALARESRAILGTCACSGV